MVPAVYGRSQLSALGSGAIAVAGVESRHEISCFADEVVVDFPSVAPAVDRIRSAFLADERPAALIAMIQLSRREAREGTRIPLEVPVRTICHACGGRGETWSEPCVRCDGSGSELLRHQLQVSVPAGVLHGTRVHFSLTPRHHPPTRIELRVVVSK